MGESQPRYFLIRGIERVSGRHVQLQFPGATAQEAVARAKVEGLQVLSLAAVAPDAQSAEPASPTDAVVTPGGRNAPDEADAVVSEPAHAPAEVGPASVGSATARERRRRTPWWRFRWGWPEGFRFPTSAWFLLLVPVAFSLAARLDELPRAVPAAVLGEAIAVYLFSCGVAVIIGYVVWWICGRNPSASEGGVWFGIGLFAFILLIADSPGAPAGHGAEGPLSASPARTEGAGPSEAGGAGAATRLIIRAAERGDAEAQLQLGHQYELGMGVTRDNTEAARWYRQAAEQGLAEAQTRLGTMYDFGLGVRQDAVEGARWYRRAAEQGHAGGQFNLGAKYGLGHGVPQDTTEGARWIHKAAEQGHADAQGTLGNLYVLGQGVSQDFVQAYKWLTLAAEQDVDEANELRGLLQERLTSEEIAQGQRLADQWRARVQAPRRAE